MALKVLFYSIQVFEIDFFLYGIRVSMYKSRVSKSNESVIWNDFA